MAVEIKVPAVGESITEGTLTRWFKKDGEAVRADEPVFELETEKATTEIGAPVAGRLKIGVPEGQTVAIGTVVGVVDEVREPSAEAKQPVKAGSQKEQVKPTAKENGGDRQAAANARAEPAEVLLSPAARRLAEEQGIDPARITGTGRAGRVTKEDVQTFLDEHQSEPEAPNRPVPEQTVSFAPLPAAPDNVKDGGLALRPRADKSSAPAVQVASPGPRETRQRMSAIRQRIAERLVTAQNSAAILTTFNEADVSAVSDLRSRYREAFREQHGVSLGFMSFFVKASIEALRAFPIVNARIDGADIVYQHFHDIGVAVSTDKGLMVPVLRDADHLTFAEIEKQVAALANKAREGKIAVADLQGGTFTITNGGVFGSLLSTPILNSPQSAILGMHSIQKRPVAIDDQIVIRPMMYLALSYDHRLIDGKEAVQFLVRVKECIETPERLLLEI